MNTIWIWLAAAPALSAPLWWPTSQADARGPDGALRRVASARDDTGALRVQLTHSDLEARMRAFEEVVGAARHDDALRRSLEEWAQDHHAPELAWTSKLALRELDRRDDSSARRGGLGTGSLFRGRDMSDLERRFDELQRQFGGLDSMFGDLQREMDRMFSMPAVPAIPSAPGARSQSSQSQSYSMQVGPDGVTVEVTEDVDGEKETKRYTADSVDELLKQHPELSDRIGSGPHVQFFGGGPRTWTIPRAGVTPRTDPTPNERRLAKPLGDPAGPRTDILGVVWSPPDATLLEKAQIESGVGLKVDSTQDGSIAEILGIRPGDVLIELNGTTLKDGEDVRRVLRERKADEDVKVVLLDGKGQRHTLTWKPDLRAKDRGNETETEPKRF